jgi:hypothetical protein
MEETRCVTMRHKLTLGVLLLGLTLVVFAETGDDDGGSIRALVDGIVKEFDASCAEADKQYDKNIAPAVKRHNQKRVIHVHNAGTDAMRKLKKIALDAKKNESPVGEVLAKDAMAYVDKIMGQSEAPLPLQDVWRMKFQDHHYLAVLAPVTWDQAVTICKKMGGHLAYIETQKEMDFCKKLVNGVSVYVGASDKQKEGDWRWLNGRRVKQSFWIPNQPVKSKHIYGTTLLRDGLLSINTNYASGRGFLCEWDK